MRARWLLAFLLSAAGCFDSNTDAPTPCRPACRDGFTCVYGTCVSLCNPPCGTGTQCVALDVDRGMCVAEGSDAATTDVPASPDLPATTDVSASPDVPAQTDVPVVPDDASVRPDVPALPDVPAPPDVPATSDDATVRPDVALPLDAPALPDAPPPADRAEMDTLSTDAPSPTDAPVPTDRPDAGPRDAGSADGAAPCGRPSEPCCAGIACLPGALCQRDTCVGYTPATDECLSNRECAMGRTCAGGRSCGTNPNWRWCYQCLPIGGVARFGDRCNAYTDCATGVCNLGRCSYACDPGPAGDGQCQGFGVRDGRCVQIIFGLPPIADGGVPRAWQTQGACEIGCARNGDCATGTACIPISDDLQDRVTFICGTSRATALAGTPCRFGDDCQSGMCIAGANPMGGAACSAPCTVDGDCPSGAPVCTPIRLFTSNGTAIPARGCLPRR